VGDDYQENLKGCLISLMLQVRLNVHKAKGLNPIMVIINQKEDNEFETI
jgi:hypothetical protein